MRQTRWWLAFTVLGLAALTISDSQATSMIREPATAQARTTWFKGNLHAHSLWSDGNDFPDMIADWYRRHGYHFLTLSDHNILSRGEKWMSSAQVSARSRDRAIERYRRRFGDAWVDTRTTRDGAEVRLKPLSEIRTLLEESGRFLLIEGEEITDSWYHVPIHLNATNVQELVKPRGGLCIADIISHDLAAVAEQSKRLGRPILAHLNHPNFFYAITAEEIAKVTRERYFEVYNGHPDVHHLGDRRHASVERMWDIINTLRVGEMKAEPVYGLATDDSHNYFGQAGASPGRGWIMVRAPSLTPDALILAMEAGDFYASSGVTLRDVNYSAESGTIEVNVEPDGDARFSTQFIGTRVGYDRSRKFVRTDHGMPLHVTKRYSDDVGTVFARVEGTTAQYKLEGDELYVRAVVTSTRAPDNPSFSGQRKQAWTQPVGWRKWVKPAAEKPSSENLVHHQPR
jgi:hypothetical protein